MNLFTSLILLLCALAADAQSITLAWEPVADVNVTNYAIAWGASSGGFTESNNVGTNTSATISVDCGIWWFAVAAQDDTGAWSGYSDPVCWTNQCAQLPLTNLRVVE